MATPSGTKLPLTSPLRSDMKQPQASGKPSPAGPARTRARRNRKSPGKAAQGSKKLNTILEESPASLLASSQGARAAKNARISDTLHDPRSDISEEADGESEGYGEDEREEENFEESVEPGENQSLTPGLGQLSTRLAQSFANTKKRGEAGGTLGQNSKWTSA